MALKPIAVQGMLISGDQTTLSPLPGPVLASYSALPPTELKCKLEGKLIHRDGDQITVSGITVPAAGATIPDPLTYTVNLNSSATKTKATGTEVLLEGDQSDTINANPLKPGTPPTPHSISFKAKIEIAGQTKGEGT